MHFSIRNGGIMIKKLTLPGFKFSSAIDEFIWKQTVDDGEIFVAHSPSD